jgi:DNA-directed RNA polymerase subunit RPC12/RpoP
VRAESTPCLRCEGPYRIDEHTAEYLEGQQVRVIHARCHHCGARRVMYFRVRPALPS